MSAAERTRAWTAEAKRAVADMPGELCLCGCGQYAGVWHVTDRPKGRVRGQPKAYLKGHDRRKYRTPEERTAALKRWRRSDYQRNREKRLAQQRAAREANPAMASERRRHARIGWSKERRARERQTKRAWQVLNRHSRRDAVGRTARGDDRSYVELLLLDPCAYCGGPCEHIDHIVPVDGGGLSSWENLTASCASCNTRKRNYPLLLWLARR